MYKTSKIVDYNLFIGVFDFCFHICLLILTAMISLMDTIFEIFVKSIIETLIENHSIIFLTNISKIACIKLIIAVRISKET